MARSDTASLPSRLARGGASESAGRRAGRDGRCVSYGMDGPSGQGGRGQRKEHESDKAGRSCHRRSHLGLAGGPQAVTRPAEYKGHLMRIGYGYDVHPLAPGGKLILGGVDIPHSEGVLGRHYPSSDSRYKGISSLKLLEDVMSKLKAKGYRVGNIDTVIVAQAPRLAPHLAAMQKKMAEAAGIDPDRVNVKVKSGEGLDAVGREEGMIAHAVCLIEPV